LLIAGTGAQASRWVPVATGPAADPTGLYVDRDSLKGTFPVRTIREKFLNSYREEKLSLVEINCARGTSRVLAVVLRSPNGSVLQSRKFPNAKSNPIGHDRSQETVRTIACKVPNRKATTRHRALHR
jgi:hypothetical protein